MSLSIEAIANIAPRLSLFRAPHIGVMYRYLRFRNIASKLGPYLVQNIAKTIAR